MGIWDVLPREQFLPFIFIYKQCACYKNWDIWGFYFDESGITLHYYRYSSVSAVNFYEKAEFPFDTDVFSEEQRVEPFCVADPSMQRDAAGGNTNTG